MNRILSLLLLIFAQSALAQSTRTVAADTFQFNVVGNHVTMAAPSLGASYGLTLPTAQGSNGTTLINGGSGVLSWGVPASGSVTSVNVTTGSIGLTATGGPITSSGSIALGGTLAIIAGGTGQTTQTAAFNALSPTTTKGDLIVYNGTNDVALPVGANNYILTADSSQADGIKWAAAPAGGVTSVGFSVPATSILGVTGSPVTTSGTLGLTTTGTSGGIPYFSSTSALSSSSALTASQLVLGGGAGTAPSSLAAGTQYQPLVMGASTPGYGALNLAQSAAVTGALPVANGGTGLATLTANNVMLGAGTSSPTFVAPGTSGNVLTSNGTTWTSGAAPATGVTSVAMTVPSFLSVSGSPITSTGTLAVSLSGTALPLLNGGTGQTTQQAAINALTGTQSSGTYLRSNGTNASLSTIQAADVPTLNQSTTGTAANITGTSNSTLTTLSALSLPGSQVSGNISGTASNITGTSNSTLTTLSSLSLPGSQVSGNISGNAANVTGTVGVANGGTGLGTLTANNVILGAGTSTPTFVAPSTSGNVLQSNGTTWQSAAITAGLANTYQASSSFTAAANANYLTNTTAGAIMATLPSCTSSSGQLTEQFVDDAGTWASNNLTIQPSGSQTIQGITAGQPLIANLSGAFVQLSCDTTSAYWTVSTNGYNYLPIATTSQSGGITLKSPTQTIYGGSTGTYTVPAGVLWLRVRLVGAGGGGGGAGTSSTAGTAGNATTFGTSFLSCNGGGAGQAGSPANISQGGTCSVGAGASGISQKGNSGGAGANIFSYIGGAGGTGPFTGGGVGGPAGANGISADSNSGGGGGGGGGGTTYGAAGGGAGGGFMDVIIPAPLTSYSYSVGGNASGGTGTTAGGNGAAGIIIVEEHYY